MLGRQQDRTAPLAAEAEALHKPQDYQQDRRGGLYVEAYLCNKPINTVATPITNSEKMSIALRPIRPLKWPKTAHPEAWRRTPPRRLRMHQRAGGGGELGEEMRSSYEHH